MNITESQLDSILSHRTPRSLAEAHFKLRAAADRALAQLDTMVGIRPVKERLSGLADVMLADRLRHAGKNTHRPPHFVFAGNPGTGKTSVAKVLAEVLHGIGCLEKTHLRSANRAQLVDRFIGGTAPRVNEAVDGARGGVLFIDEAYALVPKDSDRDFGQEAVATLLERLENDRGDFVCVAAGYPKEMRRFLDSNPGLASRFTCWIDFPDFLPAELMEILTTMARTRELSLTDRAQELLWPVLQEAVKEPGFANARTARIMLDDLVIHQARRLRDWKGLPSHVALRQISGEDVEALQVHRQQRSTYEVIRPEGTPTGLTVAGGPHPAPSRVGKSPSSSLVDATIASSEPGVWKDRLILLQVSLLVMVLAALGWMLAREPQAWFDPSHPSRWTILMLWLAVPLLLAPQLVRLHARWCHKAWFLSSGAMTVPLGIRRWLRLVFGIYGLVFKATINVLTMIVLAATILTLLYWSAKWILAVWGPQP